MPLRTLTLVVPFVALVGCAKPAYYSPPPIRQDIRGPDGYDDWIAVSCKGSQADCFDRAGRVCPYGYDVADETQAHSGETRGTSMTLGHSSGEAYVPGGPTVEATGSSQSVTVGRSESVSNGELLIKCKRTHVHGARCAGWNNCEPGQICFKESGETVGHCVDK